MRYKLLINRLLLTMLICTTINYVKARPSHNITQPSFGIKLGISFNRTNMSQNIQKSILNWQRINVSSGNIFWIMGGLTGEYPFTYQFAAAIEIIYERKGCQQLQLRRYEESIALPILLKYYPKSIKKGVNLQLGIQPSLILSKRYFRLEIDNLKQTEIKEENLENEEITRLFDLALIGGIEYTFKNGLKLGTRVSMGILDRYNVKGQDQVATTYSAGNQLYIGYNVAQWF
ncbi:MAG: porin family protein [Candidatus Amoebophilus sp.]